MRRRRHLPPPPEDDGMVLIRGQVVTVDWARWNAEYHMRYFDELPRHRRDEINYAETPETGARPTPDLIGKNDAPYQHLERMAEAKYLALEQVKARLKRHDPV